MQILIGDDQTWSRIVLSILEGDGKSIAWQLDSETVIGWNGSRLNLLSVQRPVSTIDLSDFDYIVLGSAGLAAVGSMTSNPYTDGAHAASLIQRFS